MMLHGQGHGHCHGKQHSTGTGQGGAQGNQGTLDLKAQMQSCGESCSGGQGAGTALRGKSWVQIPGAFQGVLSLISTSVACWKRSQTVIWIMVLHTSVA